MRNLIEKTGSEFLYLLVITSYSIHYTKLYDVCQQHLSGMQAVTHETRFVGLYQTHLSDSRRRLQLVQGMRASDPAQPGHPFGDRAG